MGRISGKNLLIALLFLVIIAFVVSFFFINLDKTVRYHYEAPRLGVFFVNGKQTNSPYSDNREHAFPTQDQTTIEKQAKIIFLKPKKTNKPNLVLVPGFGLTSDLYLATPDQRQGWAQMFYMDGFPVYLITPPERSGYININAINACLKDGSKAEEFNCDSYNANLGKTSLQMPWETWGFGTEYGVLFKDSKFPAFPLEKNYIEQFAASFVVYQGKSNMDMTAAKQMNQVTEAALLDLLKKIGPSVIVLHSGAGAEGYGFARDYLELVKGIVAIETSMCPENNLDGTSPLGKIPFLGIWGDHIYERGKDGDHPQRYMSCKTMTEAIEKEGEVPAKFISLPEDLNIYGNSHIMMQDTNNRQIEKIIVNWLEQKGVS